MDNSIFALFSDILSLYHFIDPSGATSLVDLTLLVEEECGGVLLLVLLFEDGFPVILSACSLNFAE